MSSVFSGLEKVLKKVWSNGEITEFLLQLHFVLSAVPPDSGWSCAVLLQSSVMEIEHQSKRWKWKSDILCKSLEVRQHASQVLIWCGIVFFSKIQMKISLHWCIVRLTVKYSLRRWRIKINFAVVCSSCTDSLSCLRSMEATNQES